MTESGVVSFPVDVDLVPGRLQAHVFFHQVDTHAGHIACWSYVTEGLRRHGQRELVFTLRCEPDEHPQDVPRDPLQLFRSIDALAQQGHRVDVGGVTQFGKDSGLFGRHLAYVSAQPLPDVVLPPGALAAMLVTDDELRAVQEFGISRVASRLGSASRHFPCPRWSDRLRPGLVFEPTRRNSILSRVLRSRVTGVQILQEGQQTSIRVGPDAATHLRTSLADLAADTPLALLTDFDQGANGCLVWEPGQSGLAAITPPGSDGSRMCGCFALFVPAQPANDVRLVEDGIALMLTADSWARVREALSQVEGTVSIDCQNGRRIVVEPSHTTYWNPIDSMRYVADWRNYTPDARAESRPQTALVHLRLLDTEIAFEQELGTQRLIAFGKSIEAAVEEIVRVSAASYALMIEVSVSPERTPRFQLAFQDDAPQQELYRIYDALSKLDDVRSRRTEVRFQMQFKVGGTVANRQATTPDS